MPDDPLHRAKALAQAGRDGEAVRVAWRAVMPAAISNDRAALADAVGFAQGIADASDGSTHREAARLALYCKECLEAPNDALLERWSLTGLFSRRRRQRRCPDCAEDIAAEARVCRYCGYRYPDPS